MIKNKIAQKVAPGNFVTANGKTINARPEPELTTSFTSCCVT
jgi:hypothetical protein